MFKNDVCNSDLHPICYVHHLIEASDKNLPLVELNRKVIFEIHGFKRLKVLKFNELKVGSGIAFFAGLVGLWALEYLLNAIAPEHQTIRQAFQNDPYLLLLLAIIIIWLFIHLVTRQFNKDYISLTEKSERQQNRI